MDIGLSGHGRESLGEISTNNNNIEERANYITPFSR